MTRYGWRSQSEMPMLCCVPYGYIHINWVLCQGRVGKSRPRLASFREYGYEPSKPGRPTSDNQMGCMSKTELNPQTSWTWTGPGSVHALCITPTGST